MPERYHRRTVSGDDGCERSPLLLMNTSEMPNPLPTRIEQVQTRAANTHCRNVACVFHQRAQNSDCYKELGPQFRAMQTTSIDPFFVVAFHSDREGDVFL